MHELQTNVRASNVVRARRLLQKKFRDSEGAFLVEGPQAVREAARYAHVREVFVTAETAQRYPEIISAVQERRGLVCFASDEVVAHLTSAVTPQGIVAVTEMPNHKVSSALHSESRLVVTLAYVRDPGNAGSVMRVADAVGADGVLATTESVDLHNSKVVRASAGSLFHVPCVEEVDLAEVIERARSFGLQVFAADGSGETLSDAMDLARPTMWVFGNEAWGIPDEILSLVDRVVALPIYGKAESLNLATAAAVCLYASAQAQRAN